MRVAIYCKKKRNNNGSVLSPCTVKPDDFFSDSYKLPSNSFTRERNTSFKDLDVCVEREREAVIKTCFAVKYVDQPQYARLNFHTTCN